MSKTIFKLALLSDDDCDFTFFTNLCQNLPDLDISLRFISPQTRLDIDEISHEIPIYLVECAYFENENFKKNIPRIIESNAPIICLLANSSEEITKYANGFQSDLWLYKDSLNAPIFKSTLTHAADLYRTREQASYFRQQFHESEKRFINVFRGKGEAVIVVSKNGLIRFVNSASEGLGIARHLIGQQFPFDLNSGQIREIDLKPLIGSEKIVEITVSDLIWENEICYTIGLRDTSKQRKLEDELVTFRQVIQLSPLPILITDRNANILYVNKQFENVSGYQSSELVGQRPSILKSDVHDDTYYKNLWKTILSGKSWTGLICNKSKKGNFYWEKQLISPVKNFRGDIVYFVSIRVDDIEQKKQQQAKQKAETLKSVQELAGGIAHEFSQPLQVLSISMVLLEKEIGESEYFIKANKMIKRIISLVDSLKSITTLRQQDYLSSKILDIKASSDKLLQESQQNKILIIDDEPELLESLVELLNISGYNCDGVSKGIDALDYISKTPYRLIISDMDMPGMSGVELFKKIKEAAFDGYFIFMTGYEVDSEYEDIIKMADAFLTKPFELTSLKNMVDRIFNNSTVKVN